MIRRPASLAVIIAAFAALTREAKASPSNRPKDTNRRHIRLPGRPLELDFDDVEDFPKKSEGSFGPSLVGSGREFNLFRTPPASRSRDGNDNHDEREMSEAYEKHANPSDLRTRSDPDKDGEHQYTSSPYHSAQFTSSSSSGSGSFTPSNDYYNSYFRRQKKYTFFQPVSNWWTSNISPSIKTWPKIQCRVEPTTTLKIRKTFRPLGTIVRLGANFNTQLGVWQFKSSWEDAIIGGKLTLAGRELQLTKSWQLSVGAMEDLVTRLRLRAAVDLSTYKAYVRVGFRTERLSPINVMEGFTLQRQVPLDGPSGHVKLQIKANFALPEPEVEYSTEAQRSLIGMGDIQINIEELNLLLDY